jgi:dephospho-CoA kinase
MPLPRPSSPPKSPPKLRSPATAQSKAQPKNLRRPVAVAVTGGIGAGKSEALRAFARQGAATLSSDEIVHGLIAGDEEVRGALRERFGTTDRAAIGAVVFEDPEALAALERLLHPRVQAAYADWLAELERRSDPPAVAVVEIPLLYETGADARFDQVVVVTAPADLRAARTSVRPDGRAKRLLPEEEKIRRASFVYVNDGTIAQLEAFVAGVLRALSADAPI